MVRVFNSISRKKEPLKMQKGRELSMYVCGPTVYGPSHLGHARTYISFDIIRRYLEFSGFKVKLVINITDVHDDMIKEAEKQKTTIFKLGEKYSGEFFEDMKKLKIKEADVYPKVTENIREIIQMIELLKEKGFAYKSQDGVYFDISKLKDYGKLSRVKLKKQVSGRRVETDKYEKEEARDFALWKKAKEGEPFWKSPFGNGRPGWHIECSVMSEKHLGLPVDIHCGAKDLIFPHHENEIAQSESAVGKKPFAKYWLHSGFLMVNGQKMSKSLGNFITVPELLKKHDARIFRFMIAQINYDSSFDFTEKKLIQAKKTLGRMDSFVQSLTELKNSLPEGRKAEKIIEEAREKMINAMDNNFNTSKAFAEIFRLETKINRMIGRKELSEKDAGKILSFLKEINEVFDVFEFKKKKGEISEELMSLIELRSRLRKEKKFREADEIRKNLLKKGVELDDSEEGTKWRKA